MKTNPLYHMKNKLLVANWKSNKTKIEAKDWLVDFSSVEVPKGIEVVILPPFTLLDVMMGYARVNSLPFKIGAQDISPFDVGAYTGEISASQIKEFADYVLIGHSERRKALHEDAEMIVKKTEMALAEGLIPIVCISSLDDLSKLKTKNIIIAYEPIEAIGTGNASSPESVEEMGRKIKDKGFEDVIYGGSVDFENVKSFLALPSISGSLIGGESLDSKSFMSLVENAV